MPWYYQTFWMYIVIMFSYAYFIFRNSCHHLTEIETYSLPMRRSEPLRAFVSTLNFGLFKSISNTPLFFHLCLELGQKSKLTPTIRKLSVVVVTSSVIWYDASITGEGFVVWYTTEWRIFVDFHNFGLYPLNKSWQKYIATSPTSKKQKN